MSKVLIIIPGLPKLNIHSGWSGMFKDFYNEISKNNNLEIKIYSLMVNPYIRKELFFLNKFVRKEVYINHDQISLFELIKRIFINGLVKKIPIQSVIYSPYFNKEKNFKNLVKNSDYIFYFTERVIADIKNIKIQKKTIKKNVLFLVDPLSKAFENHAIQESNLIKKYIYKREAKYLKRIENKLLKEFDINTLVNISDKKYLKKDLSSKIIYHPLKPFLKNNKNLLNHNYLKNRIYLIGNYFYKPNMMALKNFLKFLEKDHKYLNRLFKSSNLKIDIVGYMGDKNQTLIKTLLLNYKLNEFVFFKGSVKNIESLRKEGLATISYLPTQYGRQTKDYDSINMLMPILRLDNSNSNHVSKMYKNEPFFIKFQNTKQFMKNILQIKDLKNREIMEQKMKKYLDTEKKLFQNFCKNVVN